MTAGEKVMHDVSWLDRVRKLAENFNVAALVGRSMLKIEE